MATATASTATSTTSTTPPAEEDAFEAMGLGADLYNYRDPYRQYLPCSASASAAPATVGAAADDQLLRLYQSAAEAIVTADFLLIGAGAGMGVDSGLAAYADVAAVPAWAARGHTYATLCR